MSESGRFAPGRFVHAGPVVVVPGRVAAWLDRECGLRLRRLEVRGSDPELSAVLTALAVAADAWRSSAFGSDVGTEVDVSAEPAAPSTVMSEITSIEAARRLGLDPRAVRKAAAAGRLRGRRTAGGTWLFAVEDVEGYRSARRG